MIEKLDTIINNIDTYMQTNHSDLFTSHSVNFIGYKYNRTDKYFLFYISIYNNTLVLSYRLNINKYETKKINIEKMPITEIYNTIEDFLKESYSNKLLYIKKSGDQSKQNILFLNPQFYILDYLKMKETFTEEEYDSYIDFGIEAGTLIIDMLSKNTSSRNINIFRNRMNILENENTTLEYIGNKYGVTGEKINKVIGKIKEKLYMPDNKNKVIKLFNTIPTNDILNYLIVGIYNTYNMEFLKLLLNMVDYTITDSIISIIKKELKKGLDNESNSYLKLLEAKLTSLIHFPNYPNPNSKQIFDSLKQERNTNELNNTGKIILDNSESEVEYESGLEKAVLCKLSKLAFVKEIKIQSLVIKYEYKNKIYNYYPDIQLLTKDNVLVIIEVKPLYNMMDKIVIAKYRALRKYSEDNGFGYLMIDNGYNTFESIDQVEVDQKQYEDFINMLKDKKVINYKYYKEYRNTHNISQYVISKIILENEDIIEYSTMPFYIKYKDRNNNYIPKPIEKTNKLVKSKKYIEILILYIVMLLIIVLLFWIYQIINIYWL